MLTNKNQFFTFSEKFKDGERGEKLMDRFFSKWFYIEYIPSEIQKIFHYDREFTSKSKHNESFNVEYKTDLIAVRTGNFFVETDISDGVSGWLYKTCADWIAILIGEEIYLVDINVLRESIRINKFFYKQRNSKPTKKINNQYYHSIGYLMPVKDLERISNKHLIVF